MSRQYGLPGVYERGISSETHLATAEIHIDRARRITCPDAPKPGVGKHQPAHARTHFEVRRKGGKREAFRARSHAEEIILDDSAADVRQENATLLMANLEIAMENADIAPPQP